MFEHSIEQTTVPHTTKHIDDAIDTQCPACHKRYRVDPRLIASERPRFACVQCHAQFYFDYVPGQSLQLVESQILKIQNCPKCRHEHAPEDTECARCGIVFARYRVWRSHAETLPFLGRELSQLWRDLINDYDNDEKHELFIEKCHQANKLDQAARSYSRILAADGADERAQSAVRKITALAVIPRDKPDKRRAFASGRSLVLASHGLFMAGLAAGVLIFLGGVFFPSERNLVGVGAALLVALLGVYFYMREG